MSRSLREGISKEFYRTTAARSHVASREYYDRAADGLLRRLQSWLPRDRDARCVDLACGCGELLYLLERERFRNIAGVDLCKEELDQARVHVRGELVCADVLDYLRGSQPHSVDLLTALNFLEHLPKDGLLAILTEARRVLRPCGVLVAMVPNAVSPFGALTRHWDMSHEWAFTVNNFWQLASLTRFSAEVEFRECGPVPHGVLSGARWVLWQIIRAGISIWLLVEMGGLRGGIYTMDMLVRLRVPGK